MYTVLIVDDERLIRSGLQRHFPWADHGMEVLGVAANGKEALKFVRDHPVDLVITDVCMPIMNGIDLALHLRKEYPSIQLLFISSYDNLDYLKAALIVEAGDYILKSIDFDELAQALDRIRNKIEQNRRSQQMLSAMEEQLNRSLPLLKERFLTTLIRDDVIEDEFFDNQLRFLQIRLDASHEYILLLVRICGVYANYAQKTERERQLYSMMILANIEKLMADEKDATFFSSALDELVCVLPVSENAEDAYRVSGKIASWLESELGIRIRVGVSLPFTGYPEMKQAYQHALRALTEHPYASEKMIVDQHPHADDPYSHMEELLKAAITSSDREALNQLVDFLRAIKEPEKLESFLFYLLLLGHQLALENSLQTTKRHYDDLKRQCESFFCQRNSGTLLEEIVQNFERMLEDVRQRRSRQTNASVAMVEKYIASHLDEALTLAELAGYVYLTPAYLCQLFKQETGQNLTEYITKLRIEKAKELLLSPEIKLYDICTQIGLASVSYFSRLFKKHTGTTPSEYRRILCADFAETEEDA